MDPIALMRAVYGDDMYIVYFQNYGAADALLARDVGRVFRTFMRKNVITNVAYAKLPPESRGVRRRNRLPGTFRARATTAWIENGPWKFASMS